MFLSCFYFQTAHSGGSVSRVNTHQRMSNVRWLACSYLWCLWVSHGGRRRLEQELRIEMQPRINCCRRWKLERNASVCSSTRWTIAATATRWRKHSRKIRRLYYFNGRKIYILFYLDFGFEPDHQTIINYINMWQYYLLICIYFIL